MAAGAALAVFTLPLFPAFARDFIDLGQKKITSVAPTVDIDFPSNSDSEDGGTDNVPADAKEVFEKFITKLNKYDENGIKKLSTPRFFAEARTGMLMARNTNSQIHLLNITPKTNCIAARCELSVQLTTSGGFALYSVSGTDPSRDSVVIVRRDGNLLVDSWD